MNTGKEIFFGLALIMDIRKQVGRYDRWSYLPQKREGMARWTEALENRLRDKQTIGSKG